MTLQDRQLLGKTLLARVDQLIEVIFSLGLEGKEGNRGYYEQGCLLVREILVFLEQLIGPKDEYFNDAIKELIAQRLPDQNLFNSFGGFQEILERMYQEVRSSPPLKPTEESGRKNHSPQADDLYKAINYLFSQFNLIKNYRHQGCSFSYYIPALKIAIDDCSGKKGTDLVRKEYICRQSGINFISIPCRELPCSREIIREIKRRLDSSDASVLK